MHPFYNDAGFWAFLSSIVGSMRWLMKVAYAYRLRSDRSKHSYSLDLVKALDIQVKQIIPVIEEHTKIINSFNGTAQGISNSEKLINHHIEESSLMMRELKIQFGTFKDVAMKAEALSVGLINEIDIIKTQILELKKGSGNIFVTTKKEKL